jgi:hypothetical protein
MRPQLRNISILLVAFVGAGLLAASARAAAPSNTSPPTITATLEQGRTLTVRTGTWTNSPSTFFYRWQRCSADGTGCGNIDKATQRTYTLRANDVDQTVRVVVTASNGDGQTSANSAATDVISSNAAPKNTATRPCRGSRRWARSSPRPVTRARAVRAGSPTSGSAATRPARPARMLSAPTAARTACARPTSATRSASS